MELPQSGENRPISAEAEFTLDKKIGQLQREFEIINAEFKMIKETWGRTVKIWGDSFKPDEIEADQKAAERVFKELVKFAGLIEDRKNKIKQIEQAKDELAHERLGTRNS